MYYTYPGIHRNVRDSSANFTHALQLPLTYATFSVSMILDSSVVSVLKPIQKRNKYEII